MTDDSNSSDDDNGGNDWPACTQPCAKAGCTRKCGKPDSPSHVYGTHYCSDHR